MKTISKRNTLTLEKFQIAKLNNPRTIRGGIANNGGGETGEEDTTTTTIWTTTMTKIVPVIGG